ncbi:MAG: CDP-diacylglycerol--glycerol-3-phosphate 3-phosphatidyltransferase [Gammaproteobacteria bacterium]|nr:MAG: CDP-diacylglycerol--glycerol-3-phosphate 3-phosphatidyltransferase [Gammaproteobacteria bacterium]
MTFPLFLTLMRIALIPVLVLFFYLPYTWSSLAAAVIFILGAITDWADGYLARRMGLMSSFGAFLDPVADKLMVATALVVLVSKNPAVLFALSAAIIIGREIAISSLREWMAEMGKRGQVKVSGLGKLKTIFQMTAISFLLFEQDLFGIPISFIGLMLLYLAAALTLWSMWIYLHAAWPTINSTQHPSADNDGSAQDQ